MYIFIHLCRAAQNNFRIELEEKKGRSIDHEDQAPAPRRFDTGWGLDFDHEDQAPSPRRLNTGWGLDLEHEVPTQRSLPQFFGSGFDPIWLSTFRFGRK